MNIMYCACVIIIDIYLIVTMTSGMINLFINLHV